MIIITLFIITATNANDIKLNQLLYSPAYKHTMLCVITGHF